MKLAYIDLEQAESRVVGAIVYRLFGESTYLDACESGDLHTLVCSMCWKSLAWPQDFALENMTHISKDTLAAAKKVAKVIAYREMTYRDLAKRLGHGSNYYGQPPTMAKHSHVDIQLIRDFQDAYFTAFPGIRRWHRWVAEQVQTKRMLTTLLGRRRFFFGRPDDDATLREAIAFEPQSVATGDYMNLGIYNLWSANLPIHIFSQIHDAVAFAYDEQDEHWIIPKACNLLETKLSITSPSGQSRPFSIPTEALVGWNLAYASDGTCNKVDCPPPTELDFYQQRKWCTKCQKNIGINLDGLKVWSGSDERQRTRHIITKISDFQMPRLLAQGVSNIN